MWIRSRPVVMAAAAALAAAASAQVNVLTANYDNERSNANLQETLLAPANVSPGSFGKLGTLPVDGQVYAQPLYVSGLSIPGKGTRNVVYLATQHNSVFAYDADALPSPVLLWHTNLGPSVPNALFQDFYDIAPEIGILSTGVIDLQAGVIYLVNESLQGDQPRFQLHALDLGTGAERMNGPVTISAQISGNGAGSRNGIIAFDPAAHLQRPGLLLLNGGVYFTFGSHGDSGDWHGWLFRFHASDLSREPAVFIATPNGLGGSIWQSGRGLAADDAGAIYAITGNGDYDGVSNFGESFLKISGVPPALADWFTPSNWQELSDNDADLSAGPALMPGRMVIGGDKFGNLYLVNGDNMGRGSSGARIVRAAHNGGIFNFALWNTGGRTLLFMPELFGGFKCFSISGGAISAAPVSASSGQVDNEYVGLAISANGSRDRTGILWATTGDHGAMDLPGTLHAFDASNLGNELWNSAMTEGDALGAFAKFANPTVANGKVYVPTWSNAVTVYGLITGNSSIPAPSIAAVSNAASYAHGSISPGEIITLFGRNLGRTAPATLQLTVSGVVSSILGNTMVWINGIASPLIYASATQVSAIVPFGVSGAAAQIQVESAGQLSNIVTVPLSAASPGIFAVGGSGCGQAAALNQDFSPNSVDNPAAPGSVIILYATGAGALTPGGQDGVVVTPDALSVPLLDVAAYVGEQAAAVLYAGGAPGQVEGILQVNLQLPGGVGGPQVPVVLTVGDSASQPAVTVAIGSTSAPAAQSNGRQHR